MNEVQNNVEENLTKTIAVASKAPFWTAFKITIGIALAHLIMLALTIGLILGSIYFISR